MFRIDNETQEFSTTAHDYSHVLHTSDAITVYKIDNNGKATLVWKNH